MNKWMRILCLKGMCLSSPTVISYKIGKIYRCASVHTDGAEDHEWTCFGRSVPSGLYSGEQLGACLFRPSCWSLGQGAAVHSPLRLREIHLGLVCGRGFVQDWDQSLKGEAAVSGLKYPEDGYFNRNVQTGRWGSLGTVTIWRWHLKTLSCRFMKYFLLQVRRQNVNIKTVFLKEEMPRITASVLVLRGNKWYIQICY